MEIINKSYHTINHGEEIEDNITASTFPDWFLKALIGIVEDKTEVQRYKFSESLTDTKTIIEELIDNDFKANRTRLPEKLLKIEQDVDKKIAHLKQPVKKGALIQVEYEAAKVKKLIIVKVDNFTIVENGTWDEKIGLPKDKQIFKACLLEFRTRGTMTFVYSKTKSNYWWNTFLELEPLKDDERNSDDAYRHIKSRITKLKKNKLYHYTYLLLLNYLATYFHMKKRFDINEFVDAIRTFEISDDTLEVGLREKLNKLADDIIELPEKKGFDSQFNIVNSVIKPRMKKSKIDLRHNVALLIEGEVDNMKNTIEAFEKDGKKGVFITSEEGFNDFGGGK